MTNSTNSFFVLSCADLVIHFILLNNKKAIVLQLLVDTASTLAGALLSCIGFFPRLSKEQTESPQKPFLSGSHVHDVEKNPHESSETSGKNVVTPYSNSSIFVFLPSHGWDLCLKWAVGSPPACPSRQCHRFLMCLQFNS